MQRSKTHYEQIPVEVVKKIAKEVHHENVSGNQSTATGTLPSKLRPHRLPLLRNDGKRF